MSLTYGALVLGSLLSYCLDGFIYVFPGWVRFWTENTSCLHEKRKNTSKYEYFFTKKQSEEDEEVVVILLNCGNAIIKSGKFIIQDRMRHNSAIVKIVFF